MRGRMRYTVIVERGETGWGAHVPDLPGCIATGDSREQVLQLIREAVDLHLQAMRAEGLPIPEPRSEVEVIEVGAA